MLTRVDLRGVLVLIRNFKHAMVLSVLALSAPLAEGASIAAANCSSSAVQSAINSAADGDTVVLPACATGSWTGNVSIPSNKGISLWGAGPDSTIISTSATLNIDSRESNAPIRITGIRFVRSGGTNARIVIIGTAKNWRIDNNIFDDAGVNGAYTIRVGNSSANADAYSYGVIDHNSFINRNYATSIFVEWPRGALDPVAAGDWIWAQPSQRGTSQAVYIEDNVFSGGGTASQVIDARWGAKYVLRYNTIHNPWISTHSGCTNLGREPIWQEIYNNAFTDDGNRYGGSQIEMRSTSAVVWNNTAASRLNKYVISVDHERAWRDCSGSYGGIANGTRTYDANIGPGGYRALGQPGWGQPQPANMRSATFSGVFAWSNRDAGTLRDLVIANNNGYSSDFMQFGRELFNQSNISVGPLTSRPSSCTDSPRGVYVATDQNPQGATMYVCAAGSWVKHWEPYTYPHPQIGGKRPAPPSDVTSE